MKDNYVVIMAGGIGSRFWPKSRKALPKQFIDILRTGESLIQKTYKRFEGVCPKENIYVITNQIYSGLVKQHLPDLEDHQIIKEPLRRNTAPCVAYAAHKIKALNPNARMVVTPSDHYVERIDVFKEMIVKGLDFVGRKNSLLTLGIVPTRPDTGYGYIQYIEDKNEERIYKVKTFTEKPTLEIAKEFLNSGDFLWNSGIFLWSVNSICKSFAKHEPEMNDIFKEGEEVYNTDDEENFIKKAYTQCTNESIDYAIMEKSDNVYVLPADFGWSDLGTWQSLYEKYEKDYLGNAVSGENVIVRDAANSMVMVPDNKLVVLQGLDGYCVVDTGDVLMICKKEMEQEIKEITAEVKKMKGEKYL